MYTHEIYFVWSFLRIYIFLSFELFAWRFPQRASPSCSCPQWQSLRRFLDAHQYSQGVLSTAGTGTFQCILDWYFLLYFENYLVIYLIFFSVFIWRFLCVCIRKMYVSEKRIQRVAASRRARNRAVGKPKSANKPAMESGQGP